MFDTRLRNIIVALVASSGMASALRAPAVTHTEPTGGSGAAKGCLVRNASTGTYEEVKDGTLVISITGSIYQCQKW